MKVVGVRAYCSSANIGPCFDVAAIAHDAYYDEVWLKVVEHGSGNIKVIQVDGQYYKDVPKNENTGKKAIEIMLEELEPKPKVDVKVRIWKGVPVGVGLGSSGATAAASVKAFKEALSIDVGVNWLIKVAGMAEAAAAGEPHYDNVAASLLGNLAIIYSFQPIKAVSYKINQRFILLVPVIKTPMQKTKLLREVLPKKVNLKDVTKNLAHTVGLIAGLLMENDELVRTSMRDELVEPHRTPLIPFYNTIKSALLKIGVKSFALSGAGPTIIMPYISEEIYKKVAEVIPKEVLEKHSIKIVVKVAKPAPGAHVIESQ